MKVVIDLERMLFLRKMENESSLSILVDLEYPHIHTSTKYCDGPQDFAGLTDLELKLLIRNSAGPDVRNVFSHDALLKTVHSIVAQFPTTVVNGFELAMQRTCIKQGDARRYQYVPGSMVPKLAEGLAEHAALACAAGSVPAPASIAPAVAAPAVAAQVNKALPGTANADDFVMPRDGTSTHTIFMFCARLWKESGFSKDKSTLDNIRKKAVEQLVPTGLNISTVRTQAARWYQHHERLVL